MKYLVLCSCGHPLDRHEAAGCAGDARAACDCRRDAGLALEAAVEQARVSPWGYQLADRAPVAEAS